jgi:hypothetical protein
VDDANRAVAVDSHPEVLLSAADDELPGALGGAADAFQGVLS